MKTLNNFFDTLDEVMKIIVVGSFVAMALGFASCSDADEDEDKYRDADKPFALAVDILVKSGLGTGYIASADTTPRSYNAADPDEDAALAARNIILPGLNGYADALAADWSRPTKVILELLNTPKYSIDIQEASFGTVYVSLESYADGTAYISYGDYTMTLSYTDTQFNLVSIERN